MVVNRVYIIFHQYPEIPSQVPHVSGLFGASGIKRLRQAALPGCDNQLLASRREPLQVLNHKISENHEIVKN